MGKEVQLAIRLDSELRDAFKAKAAQADQSASQVVREWIRTYVNDNPLPAHSAITSAEIAQRSEAVNFARASVFLEGFTPSAEAVQYAQKFIRGEISLEQFANRKVGKDVEQ